MEKNSYVEALLKKLIELKKEIGKQQNTIREVFLEIDRKQKQAENIIELLRAEGIEPERTELEALGQVSVADLTYQFLKEKGGKEPMHYRDIAKALLSQGKVIPGKDPNANLLTHISRNGRFQRISSGSYALTEWGLEPVVKKRKKRSRKK